MHNNNRDSVMLCYVIINVPVTRQLLVRGGRRFLRFRISGTYVAWQKESGVFD